jgi:hypothetical protein
MATFVLDTMDTLARRYSDALGDYTDLLLPAIIEKWNSEDNDANKRKQCAVVQTLTEVARMSKGFQNFADVLFRTTLAQLQNIILKEEVSKHKGIIDLDSSHSNPKKSN